MNGPLTQVFRLEELSRLAPGDVFVSQAGYVFRCVERASPEGAQVKCVSAWVGDSNEPVFVQNLDGAPVLVLELAALVPADRLGLIRPIADNLDALLEFGAGDIADEALSLVRVSDAIVEWGVRP